MASANQKSKLQGRIKSVSIEGFRSLARIDNLELPQLTVLIGANGAGKSNLIRFFDMLGWMLRGPRFQGFIAYNGGGDDQLFFGSRVTDRINAQIRIETQVGINDYRLGLVYSGAGDTLVIEDEAYRYSDTRRTGEAPWIKLPGPTREPVILEYATTSKTAKVMVELLQRCTTYQFHDTSSKAAIKQRQDCDDFAALRSDGANLAPVLFRLKQTEPKRYAMIIRYINRILPVFADFEFQPIAGKILLTWRSNQNEKIFGPHLTSDGSLRLFCLITLLNLPPGMLPDVMLFDEPELGLHPHAIELVAAMFKRVAETRQVFIATQSPYMVNCFELENLIVASARDGATQLKKMPREEYQAWLDGEYMLSDIWLKDGIRGRE